MRLQKWKIQTSRTSYPSLEYTFTVIPLDVVVTYRLYTKTNRCRYSGPAALGLLARFCTTTVLLTVWCKSLWTEVKNRATSGWRSVLNRVLPACRTKKIKESVALRHVSYVEFKLTSFCRWLDGLNCETPYFATVDAHWRRCHHCCLTYT